MLGETEEHWAQLTTQLRNGKVIGPQVHDARIATLRLQHSVEELWSADRDFNPLVSANAD